MTRRKFIVRSFQTAAALAAGGGLVSFLSIYHCTINRCEIRVRGLSPVFDGFRIALLSDFHHSAWVPASYLNQVVQLTNSLQPDLIALTGDYVHHHGNRWAAGCFRELADLRGSHGVVGVLGNHDHYDNAAAVVRDRLQRAGISDLTNRGITLHRGGESLHIAGTGDYWREKQNLAAALSAVRRPGSAVLLQHNPDYVECLQDDRVGLVLSGHTHGGQCVFPMIGAPILPSRYGQKYVSGLCQGPTTQVFVTRGIGVAFPPVRIGCPAEIALLTLRSGRLAGRA